MTDTAQSKSHLLYGSAFMIAMRWTIRALGLGSTLVLVRLLDPVDFGIVAMATVVVGFFEVFTHTSIDLALIRDRQSSRDLYDTAWTLEIIQALGLALVLLAIAPFAARYFGDPRVVPVIWALALRALVAGFENIGVVAFRRDLEFHKEYWFGVSKKMATVALTVVAALIWSSYWALVIGLVGGRLLDVLISFQRHPYRPRFSLAKAGQLWRFSRWVLLGRIGDMVTRKLDEFTVGGQLGTVAMGNYFVAADVATAPSDEIVGPMSRGIYPVYSQWLHDHARLTSDFLFVLGSTALLCVPLGVGLSAIAPTMVPVVLGVKWLDAVPLIELLGICGAIAALTSTVEPLLVVRGRAAIFAIFQWTQFAMLVPAVLYGAERAGVVGIATAKTCVVALAFPIWFFIVARLESISARRVAKAIWPAAIAGAAMYAGVRLFASINTDDIWQTLVVQILIGAGIFTTSIWLLWIARGRQEGPEQQMLQRLRGAFSGLRSSQ